MITDVSEYDLLVICHQYNRFVKSQVDELAEHYNNITVIVRYNRIASIADYLPIGYLKPFSKSDRINDKKIPHNVKIIPLPMMYLPTSFSRRRLGKRHASKSLSVIDNNDISFDIIHSHMSWTAGYSAYRISEEYNTPYMITIHENRELLQNHLSSDNKKLFQAWENADALVRVSPNNVNKLKSYNEDVEYIPNGFEVDRFKMMDQKEAREYLDIDPEIDLLFSLGNLIKRKGFHNIISLLPDLNDDIHYIVGGHGKKKSEYQKQAKKLGVRDRLTLLGFVPNKELKYWMNAADVFVFPSYNESFGVVQLEAMACGTPVVATINGGSEHILNDRVGVLFDNPENHKQVKDSIYLGLEKSWDKDEIVSYANEYTIPSICENIVELQAKLLDNNV